MFDFDDGSFLVDSLLLVFVLNDNVIIIIILIFRVVLLKGMRRCVLNWIVDGGLFVCVKCYGFKMCCIC